MALAIVSRAAAGLPRVPSGVGHRSLSSWTGIKVHHTGGAFSSWQAIHDWQTAGRPPGERLAYIGYSFGVADGRVTELRGWDRQPAHDHQNSTLGVVFGGSFVSGLPPAADLAAFVAFCQLARARTGRQLAVTGHRDTWPRGDRRYSSCPGDRLYAHLPALRERIDDEEDEMATLDEIREVVRAEVRTATDPLHRTWDRWGVEPPHPSRLHTEVFSAAAAARGGLAEVAELRGQVAGLAELVGRLLTAPPVELTAEQLAGLTEAVAAAARAPGEAIAAALAAAGDRLAELDDEQPPAGG